MITSLKISKGNVDSSNYIKNQKESEQKDLSQLRKEFVEQVMDRIHDIDFESEEERKNFQMKIENKVKTGAKLSSKEMNYLRKYNPYMYHQMVRVQQKRESLKERLKHCRTKQEVQRVVGEAFATIHEKDPAREAMTAAVQNISRQFCSSENYKKLPNTEEELQKEKKGKRIVEEPFQEDIEVVKKEDRCETIFYNFGSNGYQEAIVGNFEDSNMFIEKV